MNLSDLTAVAAADAIARSETTSRALTEAVLERICVRDIPVAAWAHLNSARALAQADAADAAVASGRPLGPLHGVPVGVKDIIDTTDFPTECGTPVFSGRQPKTDAAVVTALRDAGAVIVGKTVTTELAFFGPGKTKNPHDGTRTPGGSSSGSAAAVADFQIPLALGTQTAGSILRPASYCGAIGYKPSFGLIAREGVLEQSSPLDTIGGYARTVEDIALLCDVLAGTPDLPLLSAVNAGLGGRTPKLAFVQGPSWAQGDGAMQTALTHFAHARGIPTIELSDNFSRGLKAQQSVQFRDIARNYGPILDAHRALMSDKLAEVIAMGRAVTDDAYAEALALREPLTAEFAALAAAYDAVLTPAAAGVAPAGLGATGSPAFNALWTYLGVPAISLPLLTVDGLPLGVQAVGLRDQDAKLLAVSAELMRATAKT